MSQSEKLLGKIDELCERIWKEEDVTMQEIGVFVQTMYPDLMELLPSIAGSTAEGLGEEQFMMGINHIMEGLQFKDKLLLADAFYYEIGSILELTAESGV